MDNMDLRALLEIRKTVSDELFNLKKEHLKNQVMKEIWGEMNARVVNIKEEIDPSYFIVLDMSLSRDIESIQSAWSDVDKRFQFEQGRMIYLTEKLKIIDKRIGEEVLDKERENILRTML